ncbi:MAG TPA: 1-acyl-sn-glycerol-3-phosphate acyltransferase [Candidatus Saccharimonadales bacterium]|nr:1-acyl-sn-glycerol-3-phosphate acyltransferase [Candidatus Saccharimonadales bacterium]
MASFVLRVMGWHPQIDFNINKHNIICVFSHTSYYDFMMMILYKMVHYEKLANLKTLIRPDYFNYFGYMLNKIGGIPATKLTDKNGGAVNRICDLLKTSQPYQLMISPKGTILKSEWRTGYMVIAKTMKADLVALGLDYERKNVYIGTIVPYNLDENDIKTLLHNDLKQIVPLYPDREVVTIRQHCMDDVSVVRRHYVLAYCVIFLLFCYKSGL